MGEIADNIAKNIFTRRKALGLSLDEVASRAGSTKSHIWELEKGRSRNPTISMVMALCNALECNLSSLLGVDISQPVFSDEEIALIHAHRRLFARPRTGEK